MWERVGLPPSGGTLRLLPLMKRSPEDFVVTEVDPAGRPVSTAADYVFPAEPETRRDVASACAKRRRVDASSRTERSSISAAEPLATLSEDLLLKLSALDQDDPNGEVVQIATLDDKAARVALLQAVALRFGGLNVSSNNGVITAERCTKHAAVSTVAGRRCADLISALSSWQYGSTTPSPVQIDPPSKVLNDPVATKRWRTELHRCIDRCYGKRLQTKTKKVMAGTNSIIEVRVRPRRERKSGGGHTGARDDYTWFVLEKRNWEHNLALAAITRALGRSAELSFAGTKDKVGITTQLMAARATTPAQLKVAAAALDGITIGEVFWEGASRSIRRAELSGNLFSIMLRRVPASSVALIDRAIEKISITGFTNFFGPQRFGNIESLAENTAEIGLRLLRRDWQGTLLCILGPNDHEKHPDAVAARENFRGVLTIDAATVSAAYKRMPANFYEPYQLLKALNRHGVDNEGCRRALLALPSSKRTLFVNAAQSLIFNRLAQMRMLDGTSVQPGDLIQRSDGTVDAVRESSISKYSITDVVLPMPGFALNIPEDSILTQRLATLLKEYRITLSNFRITELDVKSTKGCYRHFVAIPKQLDVTWGTTLPEEVLDLSLRFQLQPSSYATSFIRAIENESL